MTKKPLSDLGSSLGDHLREQREAAHLSLRQLSALAGVSNPYLSQIERGLKRPSAEILQALAKGLQVSAESLYVRAGFLDNEVGEGVPMPGVRAAVAADPHLTVRQKETLIGVYESFLGDGHQPSTQRPTHHVSTEPAARAVQRATTRPRVGASTGADSTTPAVKKPAAKKKTTTTSAAATSSTRSKNRPAATTPSKATTGSHRRRTGT